MRLGLTDPKTGCWGGIRQGSAEGYLSYLSYLRDSFSLKSVSLPRNVATCELQQQIFALFSLSDTAHKHCQITGRKTQLLILNYGMFLF